MTKQDFIKKWIGWVSYFDREKLTEEMESDLDDVSQALRIHDVVGQSEQLVCPDCKLPFTKEELQVKEHCFNCGWEFAN